MGKGSTRTKRAKPTKQLMVNTFSTNNNAPTPHVNTPHKTANPNNLNKNISLKVANNAASVHSISTNTGNVENVGTAASAHSELPH